MASRLPPRGPTDFRAEIAGLPSDATTGSATPLCRIRASAASSPYRAKSFMAPGRARACAASSPWRPSSRRTRGALSPASSARASAFGPTLRTATSASSPYRAAAEAMRADRRSASTSATSLPNFLARYSKVSRAALPATPCAEQGVQARKATDAIISFFMA